MHSRSSFESLLRFFARFQARSRGRILRIAAMALLLGFACTSGPTLASDVAGTLLATPRMDPRPALADFDGNRFLVVSQCSGSVYVQAESQWLLEQTLEFECLPEPFITGSGRLEGDVILVRAGDGAGSAQWLQFDLVDGIWQQGALAPFESGNLVLEGDMAALGLSTTGEQGMVRIYRRNGSTWEAVQDLIPPDPRARRFGVRLALDDNVLVVGDTEYEADTLGQIGSLFVYENLGGTFSFRQRLFSPTPGELGWDVDVDGARIAGYDRENRLIRVYDEVGGTWAETDVIEDAMEHLGTMTIANDVIVGYTGSSNTNPFFSRFNGTSWTEPSPIADWKAWIVAPDQIVTDPTTAHQGWRILEPDGAGWQIAQILEKTGAETFGRWGAAIASDGDLLATGLPNFSELRGGVQLYRRVDGEWRRDEPLMLFGTDNDRDAQFGYAVDVDGGRVIAGAFTAPGFLGFGAAWLFEHNGQEWLGTALDPNPDVFDFFGEAVSLSGDWAAVGARGGSYVQVYEREMEGWTDRGAVTAGDGPGGFFGGAVAISGDWLAVGARRDDDNGADAGAVYLYERSGITWNEVQKITPDDAAPGDFFGVSLDLEGSRLVVGANQPTAAKTGAVYVFEEAGGAWTIREKLVASDGAAGDAFGRSVSLRGDRLVVGATNVASNRGRVYVFSDNGAAFDETLKLEAPDGAAGDLFGLSVAAFENGVAAGAPGRTVEQVDDGGAYVFEFSIFGDGFENGDFSAWSAAIPTP